MIKVKVCGITNLEDAIKSIELGADALGFIFYKKSKRYITPGKAKRIIKELPPFVSKVGVFVNSSLDDIVKISNTTGISAIQLHGDESQAFCNRLKLPVIKTIRVKDRINKQSVESFQAQAILFDTYKDNEYGGTGISFDWRIISKSRINNNIILSGGLNPDNVAKAVNIVKPYAVDVSSGVEKEPGVKDHRKIKKFIEAVKNDNTI